MSKSKSSLQIAIAFVGTFMGAGFVSGQEILQFFGVFGGYGIGGLLLTVTLFTLFGTVLMLLAKRTGLTDFDKLIVENDIRWLRRFFSFIIIFFLFAGMVVMVAATGALLEQMLGASAIVGSVALCVILAFTSMKGAKGVLAAFNVIVPLMVVVGLVVGISSFFALDGGELVSSPSSGDNPLIGNWVMAAITFVSYNMMAGIPILTPLAHRMGEEKAIKRGVPMGGAMMLVIAVCIMVPVAYFTNLVGGAELPMLALAEKIHPALGIAYAVLLFGGMYGASLSCLFATNARLRQIGRLRERGLTIVLLVLALAGSVFGFKNLIAVFYPICGYVGLFALAGVALHFRSLKKKGIAAAEEAVEQSAGQG